MSNYFDKFFKGEMFLIQDNKLKTYRYQDTNVYAVNAALRRFLLENEDAIVLTWNVYKVEPPIDHGDFFKKIFTEWHNTENIKTSSLFDESDPDYRYMKQMKEIENE